MPANSRDPNLRSMPFKYTDFNDINYTGPGTLAGEYLRRFWQPVYRSEDLRAGEAVPVTIMSEELALYRGETGTTYLLENRCAHRHTRLNTGYIEGDNLRCLFHGWLYSGSSGQCLEQPPEKEPFDKKVHITSYPTEEYLGHIWSYMGPGATPPLPRFPDFEQPGLLEARAPEIWPCNFSIRALDSAIDWSHVAFTHRYSPLYDLFPVEQPEMSATETQYGVKGVAHLPGYGRRITYFHMPNANQFHAPVDPELEWVWHIAWRVPVDDEHHVDFEVVHIPIVGKQAETYLERRAKQPLAPESTRSLGEEILSGKRRISDIVGYPNAILVQDYVVQVGQGPLPDRQGYRLGPVDVGPIMVRNIWQRELKLFAAGKNTKRWNCPPGLNV